MKKMVKLNIWQTKVNQLIELKSYKRITKASKYRIIT